MLAVAFACPAIPRVSAEDAPGAQELRELRQAIEQQAKQIEVLAEQVGKLTRALEAQKSGDSAVKPAEPSAAPAPTTSIESPKPAADSTAEAPKAEAVPKAEPVAGGVRHVVMKGETLTSIAKHYNIPVADLKNANKIGDERKMQIGQILTIPAPKAPDTNEKKENP
jgi:LysM repeat protein